MAKVIGVKFKNTVKTYYFSPAENSEPLSEKDGVIVETAKGVEYGTIVFGTKEMDDDKILYPLKHILAGKKKSGKSAADFRIIQIRIGIRYFIKQGFLWMQHMMLLIIVADMDVSAKGKRSCVGRKQAVDDL